MALKVPELTPLETHGGAHVTAGALTLADSVQNEIVKVENSEAATNLGQATTGESSCTHNDAV